MGHMFNMFFHHHFDSKTRTEWHLDTITWLHSQAAMLLLNTSISLESNQRSVGSVVGADGLLVRYRSDERVSKNMIETTQQSMKLIDYLEDCKKLLRKVTPRVPSLFLSSAPGVPQQCSIGPQES